MYHKLFIANLPDDILEDQLRTVCEPHGRVCYLHFFHDQETGEFTGTARLTFETENPVEPILASLNAHQFDGQRMLVSPSEPPRPWPKITDAQRELVHQIADKLDEEVLPAVRTIKRVVILCGEAFALGILEKTLIIEAGDGLWLPEHNRRRTPGGTYLFLVRQSLSPKMQRSVFPRLQRKKAKSKEPAAVEESALKQAEKSSPKMTESSDTGEKTAAMEVSEQVAETPDQNAAEVESAPSKQEQLATLQRAHQEAQNQLTAVKTGKVKVSPMVAMKALVDTKRALDTFLREHPDLG